MGMQSYMATVFVGEREIGGPFVNGDFRSSLNFARRELRGYLRLAESIYRQEVMGGRRHGLRCATAPTLDFGILTETKDSETGTVESSFTVTSAYTAEDFVSDTRSAFLACVTEDFGEQVASGAASLVDGQIASMSWYRRFEIWNDLASYDICGVANADHLIDGLEELSVALADGRAFDANGGNPVFHAFHRAERQSGDRELPVPARRTHRHH